MRNEKGISLGITTIVVLATALIVLVVVATYFLGGFTDIGGGIQDVTSATQDNGTNWTEKVGSATGIFAPAEENAIINDFSL